MTNTHETVEIRTVAVLGAGGTMGMEMARNAAGAGLAVHAWNRTADKLADLAGEVGVETFATAREAVADADLVVTMLTDGPAGQLLGGRARRVAAADRRVALAPRRLRLPEQ